MAKAQAKVLERERVEALEYSKRHPPKNRTETLVQRDSAFHQSSGKINMHRGLRADRLLGLAKRDWYHVLLSMKSRYCSALFIPQGEVSLGAGLRDGP